MSDSKKVTAHDLHDILLHRDHIGCSFWESSEKTILVVTNPDVKDLIDQSEQIVKHGYVLSGGIQLIRRDNGDFNGTATFINTTTCEKK